MKKKVFRRAFAVMMSLTMILSMSVVPAQADEGQALWELMEKMAAYQEDKMTMDEISSDVSDFMNRLVEQMNAGKVTETEVRKVIKYGKVHDTAGNLAINSKPQKGYMVGKIPEGGVCTVYPDLKSGSWYWVEYKGVQGYAYSKYITLSDTKPAEGTTKPATTTVSGDPVHGKIHDTAGNLAINQEAKSTANGAKMLGKIPEGGTCVVYPNKTKNGWYWVEYKGVQGYAYSKYITLGSKHTLTYAAAKQPSCVASGNKEYWYCTGCNQYYSDSAGTKYVAKDAVRIDPVGHIDTYVQEVKPTCTEPGATEYWYCTVCGAYFDEVSCSTKLSYNPSKEIPALGHVFEDGVCTRCGAEDLNGEGSGGGDSEDSGEVDPGAVTWEGIHFPRASVYRTGQFTDVGSQWFAGSVGEAFALNLMKGNSATTFNPGGDVTLAETITMAARIHSIYHTGSESFVQSGDAWYQVYFDYAYRNGIINRVLYKGDVSAKATRSDFAAIFAKAMDDDGLYQINSIPNNAISDVPSSYSGSAAIYKLYRAGVLTGSDNQRNFRPGSFITRAECAAIVSRMGESDNRVRFEM